MWIDTANGNRVSTAARLAGTERIVLSGNTTVCEQVEIDAADAAVQIGKYCYLGPGCRIGGGVRIGLYTVVGAGSEVLLASVGNRVLIEDGCQLGAASVVYDCCYLRRGCVVAPRAVIAPFSEVSGVPGRDFAVRPLRSSYRRLIETEARLRHLLG